MKNKKNWLEEWREYRQQNFVKRDIVELDSDFLGAIFTLAREILQEMEDESGEMSTGETRELFINPNYLILSDCMGGYLEGSLTKEHREILNKLGIQEISIGETYYSIVGADWRTKDFARIPETLMYAIPCIQSFNWDFAKNKMNRKGTTYDVD
jgi:hypothetical protein